MRRVRSWHFYVSGAIGGLVGFGLMEIVRIVIAPDAFGNLFSLACQFAGFGLAVGAALGVTESVVQKKLWRAVYGLTLGAVLGLVGGFLGGGLGQAIFSLLPTPDLPQPPGSDIAIVLDASGSMSGATFFGISFGGASDPKNLRIDAAHRLIAQLEDADRVAIVDFADTAQVLHPLTQLDSKETRRRVDRALDQTTVRGGTNLTAGLSAGLAELGKNNDPERAQYLIFLTDGAGAFNPQVIQPAIAGGIEIYTIGLGPEVESALLEQQIAVPTGGRYFPVANADQLWSTFETIYQKAIRVDMAEHAVGAGSEYPLLFILLRVLSWGAMGLVIGFGQGVRENTREDLRACSFGGVVGGLIGGGLFDPVSGAIGAGLLGRMTADVVVGACIGGSMRMAQNYLVEKRQEQPRTLLTILPKRGGGLVVPQPAASSLTQAPRRGISGLVLKMKDAVERGDQASGQGDRRPSDHQSRQTRAPQHILHQAPTTSTPPKPLSFYEQRYAGDRGRAMAMAAAAGYTADQIAAHFGVRPQRVEQAIQAFNHKET